MKKNELVPKHPIDASCRALEEQIPITYNPKHWEALKAQLKNATPATQAQSDININPPGASKWIIPTISSIVLVTLIAILGWQDVSSKKDLVPTISLDQPSDLPQIQTLEDTVSHTIDEFERSYENSKGNFPASIDEIWRQEIEEIPSLQLPDMVVSQRKKNDQKINLDIKKTSDKDKFLFW